MSGARNVALDRLRAFVTMLVVLHHSVLAYCRLGHFDKRHYLASTAPIIDTRRWVGFDLLVAFNDVYFMSLMFLISGLFVLPSLTRRGATGYVRGRLVRLGLPFAMAVTVIMPVAYYPSYLQTGASLSFARYWLGYFTSYGWPGGPAWFIWVLLVLDVLVVAAGRRLSAMSLSTAKLAARRPLAMIGAACSIVVMLYVPLLLLFGPARWVTWGPFAVQSSRLLLYAACFVCGVVAGGAPSDRSLFTYGSVIARIWPVCGGAGLTAFAVWLVLQLAGLRRPALRSLAWQSGGGALFAICCVLICLAMLGGFLRHAAGAPRWLEQLAPCAFGIYLLHYAFVTWAQFVLLDVDLPAIAKAAIVFAAALGGSWILVALLRRTASLKAVVL